MRKVIAKNGFFMFPREIMERFGDYFGLEFEEGDSVVLMVFKLVLAILLCDEMEALQISHLRLARMRNKKGTKELMTIDAALETFDKFDEEVVKGEITACDRAEEEADAYGEAFRELSKATHEKHKRARPMDDPNFPRYRPFVPTIDMDTLNSQKPPGSYLWRGWQKGACHGHMAPYKRCSSPWAKAGEATACCDVLRTLWSQWLEMNGYALQDCPVKGLFEVKKGHA